MMSDKITTIAELKAAIIADAFDYPVLSDTDDKWRKWKCVCLKAVLLLIDELEASLKAEINALETIPAESVRHVRAKELRRILGEVMEAAL